MEGARESRQYVGGVSEEQRSEQERRFAELGLEDFFWSFIRLQSRVDDQGALRSNKVGGTADPASKEGLTQAHGDLWASREEDPESSGHNFDAFTPCHQDYA